MTNLLIYSSEYIDSVAGAIAVAMSTYLFILICVLVSVFKLWRRRRATSEGLAENSSRRVPVA